MSSAKIEDRNLLESQENQIASGIHEHAVLKLFPLVARHVRRRGNKSEVSITRIGCRTITSISTTQQGWDAIKLLKRGHTVAQAGDALGRRFHCDRVSLEPLLLALTKARMIQAVNGRVINSERVSQRQRLHHLSSLAAISIRRVAVPAMIRCLPMVWCHGLLFKLHPGWPGRKRSAVRVSARRNLDALSDSFHADALDQIAEQYTDEQIRIGIDLDLLTNLPDWRVARWLRRHCSISGLEHLDAALAKGKGALLCSFHFSSSHSLLVLVLWLHGYTFTGAGNITRHDASRPLPWDNPELGEKLGGCGQVKWYTSVHFASALAICRTLAKGGMALVFPDGFFVRPPQQVATYFGHEAAEYGRAHENLPVLGQMLEINTGVPWICQQSEAPLIPVKMRRISGARFNVEICPELAITKGASVRQTAVELYQELEREIRLDASSWIYWNRLDKFLAADGSPALTT